MLTSFVVFMLAADDSFAADSQLTITILIIAVIVTLQVLSVRVERQFALLSGVFLGWVTLGALWEGLELVDQLLGAVLSVALFVAAVSGGSIWRAGRREKGGRTCPLSRSDRLHIRVCSRSPVEALCSMGTHCLAPVGGRCDSCDRVDAVPYASRSSWFGASRAGRIAGVGRDRQDT